MSEGAFVSGFVLGDSSRDVAWNWTAQCNFSFPQVSSKVGVRE